MSTGLQSQFGFAFETTAGTRQTPATFLPWLPNESLKATVGRNRSKSVGGGTVFTDGRTYNAARSVAGQIPLEVAPQGLGKILRAMMGAIATTGAGPTYNHVATPGNLHDDTLTGQLGRPLSNGTVQPFDYYGISVGGWGMSCAAGEDSSLKLTLDVTAMEEDTTQTLATASWPSGWQPFSWNDMVVTLAGSAFATQKLDLNWSNNLRADKYTSKASNVGWPAQARHGGRRTGGGSLMSDLVSLTDYNRYIANSDAALSIVFTQGAKSLTIAGNVRFAGETPNVAGEGELVQNLPFMWEGGATDAANLTITLVNTDATP